MTAAASTEFGRRASGPAPARRGGWSFTAATATSDAFQADAAAPGFLALLFSPEGRIGRRDYWLVMSGALIAAVGLVGCLALSLPAPAAEVAIIPVVLVYWAIRCCVRARRWHDLGKSATWNLIGLVPVIGWIWAEAECGFRPGARGENEFGPA